jgi:hypothetical protein
MSALKPTTILLDNQLSESIANKPCDVLLLESQSEAWFSNQLAWLLDPKGSHNLGVTFLQLFLKRIGEWRSAQKGSDRKATNLKLGKGGSGKGSTQFQLSNCSVFREFFLSQKAPRKKDSALFCDLAVADLDTGDGLFLIIENKLFTSDHPDQLDKYEKSVHEKFVRAKVREFVYLTLRGEKSSHAKKDHSWVKLGWLTDIKEVLAASIEKRKHTSPLSMKVDELLSLLTWMDNVSALVSTRQKDWKGFETWLKKTSKSLLLDELRRLNKLKDKGWKPSERKNSSFLLEHSSFPTIGLQIGLATGMVVTAQLIRFGETKKSINEKILIPLGAHPDQVVNLIDIAARDIYRSLPGKTNKYLADKRRRKNHEIGNELKNELTVLYRHRYELPLLLKLYKSHAFSSQEITN